MVLFRQRTAFPLTAHGDRLKMLLKNNVMVSPVLTINV